MKNRSCHQACTMKGGAGGQAWWPGCRLPIPGCLRGAVRGGWKGAVPCLWTEVMTHLLSPCRGEEHTARSEPCTQGGRKALGSFPTLGSAQAGRQPGGRCSGDTQPGRVCWVCSGWAGVLGPAFHMVVSVRHSLGNTRRFHFLKLRHGALWEGF